MPNGHGVPLGCMVCRQYQKGQPNPLFGHCQHHDMDVDIDTVCANFDNKVNDASHSDPMEEGVLYAFVDVIGYGYPPPTEFVPLAKIADYKTWNNKRRKQAWGEAQKVAKALFEQRK